MIKISLGAFTPVAPTMLKCLYSVMSQPWLSHNAMPTSHTLHCRTAQDTRHVLKRPTTWVVGQQQGRKSNASVAFGQKSIFTKLANMRNIKTLFHVSVLCFSLILHSLRIVNLHSVKTKRKQNFRNVCKFIVRMNRAEVGTPHYLERPLQTIQVWKHPKACFWAWLSKN